VAALAVILLGATSLRWLGREVELARKDVSSTTVHPVYLPEDAARIVTHLNGVPGRKVLLAPPGVPSTEVDQSTQQPVPDSFGSPVMPDLNPILSGLTGAYTYAGHWSETPRYNEERRGEVQRFYFGRGSLESRRAELQRMGVQYLVAPVPEAFPGLPLEDLTPLAETVVDGKRFRLLRVR
jgi:arabinosyltransferase C